jgi:molecular chaperone GrpE
LSKTGKPLRKYPGAGGGIADIYCRTDNVRNIPIMEGDSVTINELKENMSKEETKQDTENNDMAEMSYEEAVVELTARLEAAEKEKEETKEQVKRAYAELENFRRRSLKEKQEMIDYANERLLFKMLALLDDISNAIDAGKKSDDYEALLRGIEMIQQKTLKTFEESGVKPMELSVGKEFDFNLHEAIMMMPSDEVPAEHIVAEVQKGYMMHDKVLRHAKVVTSSGPAES